MYRGQKLVEKLDLDVISFQFCFVYFWLKISCHRMREDGAQQAQAQYYSVMVKRTIKITDTLYM